MLALPHSYEITSAEALCRCWVFTPSSTNAHLVCTPPFSSLSSLSDKFRFEGWKNSNETFYHPKQGCSLPCPAEPGSPFPHCLPHPFLQGSCSSLRHSQLHSKNINKVLCQNTIPLIATPFLSVLFPVRCFALTHQVKTQNLRWEHLALAVERFKKRSS